MKKILLITGVLAAAGLGALYFFFKEPVFKATKGFLVNVNDKGVIIEGYDVVAYFTENKAVKGKEQFKTEYKGGTYWFVSPEHLEIFTSDPVKYAPQYGSFCGYAVSIGKLRPVDPEIFQIENGRLILQHTQEAYDLFNKDLNGSIIKADEKWPGLVSARVGKQLEYDQPASTTVSK